MPYRLRRFFVLALVLIGAWTLTAYVAVHLVGLVVDEPYSTRLVRSFVMGVWAGLLGAALESGVFPRVSRKFPFWATLAFRTALYAVVVLVSIAGVMRFIGRTEGDVPLSEMVQSDQFQDALTSGQLPMLVVFLTIGSFFINLMLQLLRVLGPGVLGQIFLGRYLRPVHEDRIFLFLDLTSSTAIAEELGPLRFSDFKNDFFYDVAEPVLSTQGQIFQYVGDEVVITWPMSTGLKKANCVACFYKILDQVESRRDYYTERYSRVPEFKAGCHGGSVVTAEIGDLKRDIVHSGDPVNTAARIEGQCRPLERQFLVSETLAEQTALPSGYELEAVGEIPLRGKGAPVRLFAIERTHALAEASADGAAVPLPTAP